MEHIVSVHDLFSTAGLAAGQPGRNQTMLTRKQFELLRFIHERLKEVGRAALLRRDEGRARSALQVRHPPADHGAGGARLHPPPAQPGARHRSDQAARIGRARHGGGRARLHAERHRGQPRPRARRLRGRRRPAGRRAGHGPHRRRHADRGDPDHAATSSTCRPTCSRTRRAFRARSARRFDDRGRHPRRRHRADPARPTPPTPATSWWR